MKLIDTHAHLDHLEAVDEALTHAYAAGVSDVVAVGIDGISNKKNIAIKKRTTQPCIHVALGIHPESLEVFDQDVVDQALAFVEEQCDSAVAIGEIGLDYWYKWVRKDPEKKAQQQDIFKKQLALAAQKDMPVIIHSRGAWRDCLNMAKDAGIKKANFHWYSGPLDILSDIIAAGYMISATPALYYSAPLQEAVKKAPHDRILIETDTPVYYRYDDGGFSATPKDVFKALTLYANQQNMSEEEAADMFNTNAKNFFNL